MTASHGPYAPAVAGLGGSPTKTLDDPVTAVFLVLFLLGAITHMTILQINSRRGKKFIMSGVLFGFCMARIMTCTLRLVWSTHLSSVPIAIAAQVFVAAGVILLFIINLIFVQRILRARHPHWAWATWFSLIYKIYFASIAIMLIALVTCTVQSFYTLSVNTKRIDRDVQLVGSTYFAVAAFLPILLLFLSWTMSNKTRVEKFGEGRFRTKIIIIIFTSAILTLGAGFRAGINYVPRPRNHPAWYHSKACFYIFNFAIEIVVVYLFAAIRVDKRFHIPNGSHGPGDYSRSSETEVERKPSFTDRVLNEEQVFDDELEARHNADERFAGQRNKDLEAGARESK